jgi:hypothetical protein
VETVFDIHHTWGYVTIVLNGLAGLYALAAWKWKRFRGKPVWISTAVAEGAALVQIILGVILVASKDYVAPRFHMFYGFVIFITIGILYQYRSQMRGRLELLYGLGGLFIMGLGIRAILQVSG